MRFASSTALVLSLLHAVTALLLPRLAINRSPAAAALRASGRDNEKGGTREYQFKFNWFESGDASRLPVEPLKSTATRDTNSEVRRIALFPLDFACVCPTETFSMNIFVMKFRQMMNDAYKGDKEIGIVCSNAEGKVAEVGTLLRITDRTLKDDGRQAITTVSRQRFRILEVVQEEPYLVADVLYPLVDEEIVSNTSGSLEPDIEALEREVYQVLRDILALSNTVLRNKRKNDDTLAEFQLSSNVQMLSPQMHPFRLQVASDFSYAVLEMISCNYVIKQQILETSSLRKRLELLRVILKENLALLYEKVQTLEEEDTLQ